MQIKLPLLMIFLPTAVVLSISISLSTYHDNFVFGQFSNASGTNTSGTDSGSGLTSTDSQDSGSSTADVIVLSQKLKKDNSGYRDLVGQVKNVGTGMASDIVVRLTVYDKDGGVVGSDYTDADRDTLPAGQKSTYTFDTESQNFDGMDHYDLSLEWVNPDSSQGYKDIAVTYKLSDSDSKGDSQSKGDSDSKDDSKNKDD